MDRVPIYALYGELTTGQAADILHCETIEARSRLHDFTIRPHRHEQLFQLLFLGSGDGEAVYDGARAILTPPCLVLVPAGVVHGYGFSNTVEGLVLTLYQHRVEKILRASPDALHALSGPRILTLTDPATMIASLVAIGQEFAGRAADREAMMEAHLAVALLTAARACRTDRGGPDVATSRGIEHVFRFRQLVDRDFATRRPIEQYAGALGVTGVHLRRLCRTHLGASPLATLNARIVLEARRLLEFTSLSVKEVAAAIGFADDAYFSRFFQREIGLTPSGFRARQRTTGALPAAGTPMPRVEKPPAAGPIGDERSG